MVGLLTKMPALAGRCTAEGIVLSNAGARFFSCEQHPGSAHHFTGAYRHVEQKRGTFTALPPSCRGGKEPLLTVRVTNCHTGGIRTHAAIPLET